jgi:translation initiation factor IF-3
VIDQHQTQLGIIPVSEAMNLAREAGLDLVEVSPNERPPVCRIMDYGKFKYERKKRQKNAAAAHVVILKEIRLRPKTDPHDREVKMRRARGFLEDGSKVQFTMLFRGRERVHREIAIEIFRGILDELGETVKVERHPAMEGRRMTMVVAPIKAKPSASSKQPAPPQPAQKAATAAQPQAEPAPQPAPNVQPPAPQAREASERPEPQPSQQSSSGG